MKATKLSRRILALALVVLCASLAAPAFAGAQQVSPTNEQYNDTLTQINAGSGPSANPEDQSGLDGNVGPLPFTGFDVLAMIAVAIAVTGLGLALQRAVSRDTPEKLG